MKRFLSLFLVVAMLFAVLAMVGCGDKPVETTATTPVATTPEATTAATTEATTAATTEATTAATTEATTEATTAATTEATTAATTATTAETTTEATTVVATEGTTVPMFLRFDFGTKTKAEDLGETSHAYLVSVMKVGSLLKEIWTEDTLELYAIGDFGSEDNGNYSSLDNVPSIGICFDDLVTYDFASDLVPGWGSYGAAPYANANTTWNGRLQYMKIRVYNPTDNNVISLAWFCSGKDGSGYSSAQYAEGLYLQGLAPTTTTDHKKTATPMKEGEWFVQIYDITMMATMSRTSTGYAYSSFVAYINDVKNKGASSSNNWLWSAGSGVKFISGLRFYLLGAFAPVGAGAFDTRANINQGDHISVDYIIFGADYDDLMAWHSYAEESYLAK